jgi:regulator of RNase E activity RraA
MPPLRNPADDQPFEIARLYRFLRVADVCDAMDGIGYFNIGLVDPAIRPLWPGMKFWGPAFTIRCVPANRPMWKLRSTAEIVAAHDAWFKEVGKLDYESEIRPGHVVVNDAGGSAEVGFWGSANAAGIVVRGAVGMITNGCCRDTEEVTLQRTPICARARGRTIIPGRIEVVEVQTRIGCGGAQVRPGDIVGCDDDGIVVVPLEVAGEVAVHGRAVLLADMRSRRAMYERAGRPLDATVDFETVETYYRQLS